MPSSRPGPAGPPPGSGSGRTALMILGAPGAGASVLACMLEAAGASPPADAAAVAAVNDRALADAGSGRDDPFGPRRRGEPPPVDAARVLEARALLRTPEPHQPLLVLSDPAQARLAPLWTAALEAEGWRVALVVLVRAPAEAAAALAAAEGVPRRSGLLLWASSMLAAERAARGARRVTVAFDRLLAEPEAELDRIEGALALRLPRRTWDAAAEIEAVARAAHRPAAGGGLPPVLAPLDAFAGHLLAAAADEPGNADVPAETERWFDGLSELAAPFARTPAAPPPPASQPSAGPDAAEAQARAEAAEAQVVVLQSALAVARRRSAEAEALLQARAAEASAGEREARAALTGALASREAAEARLEAAAARSAELDEGLADAQAALHRSQAALREEAAALDDERARHADARERLAVTGVSNHAAQTRVRELEARLGEAERRRTWLSRLLERR